jgi:hypothetical protein
MLREAANLVLQESVDAVSAEIDENNRMDREVEAHNNCFRPLSPETPPPALHHLE